VLIGRPYGLALAGSAGVQAVIENLNADFDLTMGLADRRAIAEIDGESVVPGAPLPAPLGPAPVS